MFCADACLRGVPHSGANAREECVVAMTNINAVAHNVRENRAKPTRLRSKINYFFSANPKHYTGVLESKCCSFLSKIVVFGRALTLGISVCTEHANALDVTEMSERNGMEDLCK